MDFGIVSIVSPIRIYTSLWLTSPRNSSHESSKEETEIVIFFKTHLATTTWKLIGNCKTQKQKCLLLKIEIIHVKKSKYFSIVVSTPAVFTTAAGFLLWKVTYNRWWIIHVLTCWYQTGNKVELLFITGYVTPTYIMTLYWRETWVTLKKRKNCSSWFEEQR